MFMRFFIIQKYLLQIFELLFFECTCTQSSTFPLKILPKEKTSFEWRLNNCEVPLLYGIKCPISFVYSNI